MAISLGKSPATNSAECAISAWRKASAATITSISLLTFFAASAFSGAMIRILGFGNPRPAAPSRLGRTVYRAAPATAPDFIAPNRLK